TTRPASHLLHLSFHPTVVEMSQPKGSTPQGLDCFSYLPMELNVQIMLFLDLEGLLLLTRASPTAWQHFRAGHTLILKPRLPLIYSHYGHPAAIPLVILLTRLQRLRTKLNSKPRAELESSLEPILNSILSRDCMEMPHEWESNLPILATVAGLVPELCNAFERLDTVYLGPETSLYRWPQRQTWIFVESFLRFECFCKISYWRKGFLFKKRFYFKYIFLKPFHANTPFSTSDLSRWGQVEGLDETTDLHLNLLKTIGFEFNAPEESCVQFAAVLNTVRDSLALKAPRTAKSGKHPPYAPLGPET
ncbi:uracil catabolism 4, partial [Fusarium subglutinans]